MDPGLLGRAAGTAGTPSSATMGCCIRLSVDQNPTSPNRRLRRGGPDRDRAEARKAPGTTRRGGRTVRSGGGRPGWLALPQVPSMALSPARPGQASVTVAGRDAGRRCDADGGTHPSRLLVRGQRQRQFGDRVRPGGQRQRRPSRDISGPPPGSAAPRGCAVDASRHVFVTNFTGKSVTEYARGASGNVAPIANISGQPPGSAGPSRWRMPRGTCSWSTSTPIR